MTNEMKSVLDTDTVDHESQTVQIDGSLELCSSLIFFPATIKGMEKINMKVQRMFGHL